MYPNHKIISGTNVNRYIDIIRQIFFSTSNKQTFTDKKSKEQFFYTWCGIYLTTCIDFFYLYMNEQNTPLGYLAGHPGPTISEKKISYPGMILFEKQITPFPAHFHINLDKNFRGFGAGTSLVKTFNEKLTSKKVRGVHIITTEKAKNISFYKKNGFVPIELKRSNKLNLLLMGKNI